MQLSMQKVKWSGIALVTGIGVLISASAAFATETTFTEDFTSTTYYNSSTSGAFTSWSGGAQMMFDTTQSLPAPFYHKPSTPVQNVAQSGQYIFSAYAPPNQGGKLQVLDTTTDTFTAVDLSTYGISSFINDMTVLGNHLYMTWGASFHSSGGLTIVDIGDDGTPTNPVLEQTFTDTQNAMYVHLSEALSGNFYAYVVSNAPNRRLTIFDVTDPENPEQKGSVALPSDNTYYELIETGGIVYITGSGNDILTAVNVADRDNPSLIAVNVSGVNLNAAYSLAAGADMLLIGNSTTGFGQLVLASVALVGDELNITGIASQALSASVYPQSLAYDGTYFYTNSLNTSNSTRRLDAWTVDFSADSITNVANTTVNSSLNGDIVAFSNNLWAADNYLGLIQIDTSDLGNGRLGTQFYNEDTPGSALDVAVVNDAVYVADGTYAGEGAIAVIDTSDPTAMTVTGEVPTAVVCDANRLHGGDALWTICGSTILKLLTDPYSWQGIDTGATTLNDITTWGEYAYVANDTNNAIVTYDVSTATFQLEGTDATTSDPQAITTNGEYLFVADGSSIRVMDLSDPSDPVSIRTFNTAGGTIFDLAVYGNYLFQVGSKMSALLIDELVDPTNGSPAEYATADLGPVFKRMLVQDGYAILGENSLGSGDVKIFSVKDPTNMSEVTLRSDLASTGGLAGGFAIKDGWLYIADGATDGIRAVHMTYPPWQQVYSSAVDTTANNIDSVTYTFTGSQNSGNIFYYVSNNGGANWSRVSTASADEVTGTFTFTTTGSDLRWYALLYSDTDSGFEATPVVSSVSLDYEHSPAAADTTPPFTGANPSGGSFAGPMSVIINASDDSPGTTIYYTTDGSTPTTSSTSCSIPCPVSITSTTTLKFYGVDAAGNSETTIHTQVYTLTSSSDTTAPVSAASVNGADGPFAAAINVTIITLDNADPNPSVYYTLDGSEPTTASALYSGPITISADTTLRWFAVDASGNEEDPKHEESYVIDSTTADTTAPDSVANPIGGTYESSISIVLSASDDNDPTPTIYYTTDGTTPTTSSFIYTDPITTSIDRTIKFFGRDASGNTESINIETYIIGSVDADLPVTPTEDEPEHDPAFVDDTTAPTVYAVPEDGTYETAQTVHLYATDGQDPNPTIYYSLDGSTPTRSAFVYTDPLRITSTTTVSFFALDAGGNASLVAAETYTITNSVTDTTAPTVNAGACSDGFFDIAQDIELTATDDYDNYPAIFYTLDGVTPGLFGFTYRWPITLTGTATIKFFARDASGNVSAADSTTCTIYDSSALSLKAKNKKKGVGNVRIVNKKTGEVLRTFTAFNKGGVKAEIVKVRGVKRVATIQYKKSKLLKLFDLNGNLLGQKKFRNKKAIHKLKAGNLYKGKKNGEIIVAQLKKNKGQFVAKAFTVTTSNKPRLRATKKVSEGIEKLIAKGYRLMIKNKKLLVKTPKGKKAQIKMRLVKKGGKFKLIVL